ncbi:MAG: hypothetical protein ABS88_11280 [Sphingopyxis sp. SCN 67-31]|nr:MAG: hypothetical protein ABS88_11280 [Sphingopyxis sp. SCN 67-31]
MMLDKAARLTDRAQKLEARAAIIEQGPNRDPAFLTQPSYGNAAGRAFARARDRERSRSITVGDLYHRAKLLRERANRLISAQPRVAGDAKAERDAKIVASDFHVGQEVRTLYGVRKIVKVNAKPILIEGALGPVRVEKHLAEAV